MDKTDRKLLKISTALIAIAIVVLVTLVSTQYENLNTAIIAIMVGVEVLLTVPLGFIYGVADDG